MKYQHMGLTLPYTLLILHPDTRALAVHYLPVSKCVPIKGGGSFLSNAHLLKAQRRVDICQHSVPTWETLNNKHRVTLHT